MPVTRPRPTPPDPAQLALPLDAADEPAVKDTGLLAGGPPSRPTAAGKPPSVKIGEIDAANGEARRRIHLDACPLDYRLCRSRRRSIGFLIDEDGLRITAPKWVTLTEIDQAIREKQRWILGKLTERRERSARRLQPEMIWRDGGILPYLGSDLVLRLSAAGTAGAAGVRHDAARAELVVSLPPDAGEQQLKDRVQGWLQSEARRIFSERLPLYADKLGVRVGSMALSSAVTRWGSCTADGRIRLNWRLIHFSLPLIDYVIAHELAHLREMNHGPRFWAAVASIFPDFRDARQALKEHGPETLPMF